LYLENPKSIPRQDSRLLLASKEFPFFYAKNLRFFA
jgi:hypothetical protein